MTKAAWPATSNQEKLRKNSHLSIEIHRHGRPEVIDLSDYVSRVVWEESISSPWQSLSVTWKAPLRDSFTQVLCGDWVVLRLSAGGSYSSMLARVESVDHGIMAMDGAVTKDPSSFSAIGWWAFLSGVKVFSAPGLTESSGTIVTKKEWAQVLTAATELASYSKLGDAITRLFQRLAEVKLPATLADSSATLGSLIPVVHSEELAKIFAPRRAVAHESVEQTGQGLVPMRIASHVASYEVSVVDLITGAFVPEPALIELFPSFERFDQTGRPDEAAVQAAVFGGRPATDVSDYAVMSVAGGPTQSPSATSPGIRPVNTSLAKKLGGWPSLIYRVKPFRTRPLREVAVAWAKDTTDEAERFFEYVTAKAFPQAMDASLSQPPETPQSETNAQLASILSDKFDKITWNYATARPIAHNQIRSFKVTSSDAKRVNAASFSLSFDGANAPLGLAELGLPITYDEEILRHGLRMAKPAWPFVIDTISRPPENAPGASETAQKTAEAVEGDFLRYLRSVCAQYMQFYKNNHLYGEGEVQINFREAPQFAETDSETVAYRYFDIKPGEVIAMDLAPQGVAYYAYAETVRHTISVSEGSLVSANTSIKFSHGHWGVGEDTIAKATKVPVRRGTPGAAKQDPAKPAAGVTFPPRNNDAARFASLCAGGVPGLFPSGSQARLPGWEPAGSTPGSTGLDPSKFPAWLRDWGVNRGIRPQTYNPDYYRTPLARIEPGVYDPQLIWQRVWVATAVAFVIEKYWKLQYASARIRILDGQGRTLRYDPAQNHVSGAAIDFSISLGYSTAPVLQTWACLRRLEQAARIPGGSKGLYLNSGPGGITGTSWEEAGNSTVSGAPAGSAGGVHYDFRGSFGRLFYTARVPLPVKINLLPTKYLWVNTKGRGETDLRDVSAENAPASAFLKIANADVYEYYVSYGKNDPTLWSAESPYVPNVMQVLGQTVSCFTGPDS